MRAAPHLEAGNAQEIADQIITRPQNYIERDDSSKSVDQLRRNDQSHKIVGSGQKPFQETIGRVLKASSCSRNHPAQINQNAHIVSLMRRALHRWRNSERQAIALANFSAYERNWIRSFWPSLLTFVERVLRILRDACSPAGLLFIDMISFNRAFSMRSRKKLSCSTAMRFLSHSGAA